MIGFFIGLIAGLITGYFVFREKWFEIKTLDDPETEQLKELLNYSEDY
jgi:hypothetical protein